MSETSSQIFKYPIPRIILSEFLDKNAHVREDEFAGGWIVDNETYKHAVFTNTLLPFYETCKPYYYVSKRKYLEKPDCYHAMITVIRQICKYLGVEYTTKIKYGKSKYIITYYIHKT